MVFLLQCPRLPMNIHHWTLHCKLWPLAFAQTPSHSASWALIKQTHCCIHHDPLSMHIITCSLPLPLWIVFFHIHSPSILTSACIDLNPISSKTSPTSLRWPASSSSSLHFCLFVSLCCVIKKDLCNKSSWKGLRRLERGKERKGLSKKKDGRKVTMKGLEDMSWSTERLREEMLFPPHFRNSLFKHIVK